MITQRLIKREDAARYYLSPYVDILQSGEDSLLLRRRDTGTHVVLSGSGQNMLMWLVHELGSGSDLEQFADMMTSGDLESAARLIEMLIKNGVIE